MRSRTPGKELRGSALRGAGAVGASPVLPRRRGEIGLVAVTVWLIFPKPESSSALERLKRTDRSLAFNFNFVTVEGLGPDWMGQVC